MSTLLIEDLQKDFHEKSEACKKYAEENEIEELILGDETYWNMLVEREEAYMKYKQHVEPPSRFNRIFRPVIERRINRFKDLARWG